MRLTPIAAIAAAATLCGFPALAGEGDAEYRHHTMEAVGGHMQALVDILQQKVPHTAHLALHANALNDLAGIADTLFPAGSEGGDALPAIWEDPEDFAERLGAFQTAATKLNAAVASGDGIGPAVQGLGQACKGCHDNYRAE